MKMFFTDGAIRKIDKKTVSASVFCIYDLEKRSFDTKSFYEFNSTSVRGELIALLGALEYCKEHGLDPTYQYFITDNKFLRDAFAQNWVQSWKRRDWKTTLGEEVKNKDLFVSCDNVLEDLGEFFVPIHINSHIFKCSATLARKKIAEGGIHSFAKDLVDICNNQLSDMKVSLGFSSAMEKFNEINGRSMDEEQFKFLAVMNTYVDVIAQVVADSSKERFIKFRQQVAKKKITPEQEAKYNKSIYKADIRKIITSK